MHSNRVHPGKRRLIAFQRQAARRTLAGERLHSIGFPIALEYCVRLVSVGQAPFRKLFTPFPRQRRRG